MCVFVSHPMKNATFLKTNDYHPKRVVDFHRERDTFRNKIIEIVEDFACEPNFFHFSFFFHHFSPFFLVFFFIFSFFFHFFFIFFFFFFSFFHFFILVIVLIDVVIGLIMLII